MLRASVVALLLTSPPALAEPPSPFWYQQMGLSPDGDGGYEDDAEYEDTTPSPGQPAGYEGRLTYDDGQWWTGEGHVYDPDWVRPDDQGFPHSGPCNQDQCWVVAGQTDWGDGTPPEDTLWDLTMGPVPPEPPIEPEEEYDPATDTSDCANDAC